MIEQFITIYESNKKREGQRGRERGRERETLRFRCLCPQHKFIIVHRQCNIEGAQRIVDSNCGHSMSQLGPINFNNLQRAIHKFINELSYKIIYS